MCQDFPGWSPGPLRRQMGAGARSWWRWVGPLNGGHPRKSFLTCLSAYLLYIHSRHYPIWLICIPLPAQLGLWLLSCFCLWFDPHFINDPAWLTTPLPCGRVLWIQCHLAICYSKRHHRMPTSPVSGPLSAPPGVSRWHCTRGRQTTAGSSNLRLAMIVSQFSNATYSPKAKRPALPCTVNCTSQGCFCSYTVLPFCQYFMELLYYAILHCRYAHSTIQGRN